MSLRFVRPTRLSKQGIVLVIGFLLAASTSMVVASYGSASAPKQEPGYWLVSPAGAVTGFGDAGKFGALSVKTSDPVVAMASSPDAGGYWLVTSNGSVSAFGDATSFGSMTGTHLSKPIVGITGTADGRGYWLVAADGGVFAFGDAGYYGSSGSSHLTSPVVGMSAAPDGAGYWIATEGGTVLPFGKVPFSHPGTAVPLGSTVAAMASTPDGKGYWLVTNAGKVMAFGDAHSYGSMNSSQLNTAAVGIAATPDGHGYWLAARNGTVLAFGDAQPISGGSTQLLARNRQGAKSSSYYTVGIATSYNYYSHRRHHYTSPTSTTAPVSTTRSPTSTTASPAGGATTTGQPTTTVTAAPTTATTQPTTTTKQPTTTTTHATTTTQATTSTTHATTSTTHATTTTQATTSTTHATTTTTAAPTTTTQPSTTTTPTTAPPAQQSGAAPASPPVTWCETGFNDPYTSAPAGAVTVPAGDNSNVNFSTANTVYWFASGTHTLGGTGQIDPADGDTYVGAPGAVLDGGGSNQYAFVGQYNDLSDENVTIEYLTIQHFDPSQGAGAVNGNGNNGWTEEYNLIQDNSPGAGVMLGGDNVVNDNCMTNNGEYGAQGYSYVDQTYEASSFTGGALNITFDGNEVSFNNTQHTNSGIEGGVKFWQNGNVNVVGNYVHDNYGSPGLWMDTDNAGFLVQGNYISNNGGPGIMYEISYNALIQDNTFVGNGIESGPSTGEFPTGAIYVSESGGDSRVPSNYAGELMIASNDFSDNWGGVVIYQNPNRYCGDGQDPCPLIPPAGVSIGLWIGDNGGTGNGPSLCPSNLSESSPVDYHDLCHWPAQNVTVSGNTFSFNPSDAVFGGTCSQSVNCGQSAIFSDYSSTSAYPGYTICNAISNLQNNVFSDNTYIGPWTFYYFNQGDVATPAQWQAGATNVESSGYNFKPQDAGSTFTS
jgi:parallel beta-helix repeat protein